MAAAGRLFVSISKLLISPQVRAEGASLQYSNIAPVSLQVPVAIIFNQQDQSVGVVECCEEHTHNVSCLQPRLPLEQLVAIPLFTLFCKQLSCMCFLGWLSIGFWK